MEFFSCQHLKKSFDQEVIFEDISISFSDYGITSIMGPSGCGKSTLINCLLGLEKCQGSIRFQGKAIDNFDDFRNRYTGIIFQNFHLLEYLTVKENITLFNHSNKFDSIVKMLDLQDKLNNKVCLLSGGEKQRVAIARTLMKDPLIIFCDEITGSLDEENAKTIMAHLKEISKDKLIINISHNQSLVDQFSDEIIRFNDKKIKYVGKHINNVSKNGKKRKLSFFKLLVSGTYFMKKSIFKIILSSFSLSISLALLGIILNINISLTNYFDNFKSSCLDYNILELTMKRETKIENTSFSLTKQTRPSRKDLEKIEHLIYQCDIGYNFSNLINSYTLLTNNNKPLKVTFLPCLDKSIKSYNQIITNRKGYELLENSNVLFQVKRNVDYISETNQVTTDYLDLQIQFNVIKVNEELELMQEPIFYYSYSLMEEYLFSINLENLSKKMKKDISLGQRIIFYNYDNDFYDTGSIYLFCKESKNIESLIRSINDFKIVSDQFECSSRSLNKYYMINNLFQSVLNAIEIFLTLSLIISVFLLGLCVDSLIVDEQKEIGIYKSIGVKKKQVNSIINYQVFVLLLASFSLALVIKLISYTFIEKYFYMLSLTNKYQLFYENTLSVVGLFGLGFLLSGFGKILVNKITISKVLKEE